MKETYSFISIYDYISDIYDYVIDTNTFTSTMTGESFKINHQLKL